MHQVDKGSSVLVGCVRALQGGLFGHTGLSRSRPSGDESCSALGRPCSHVTLGSAEDPFEGWRALWFKNLQMPQQLRQLLQHTKPPPPPPPHRQPSSCAWRSAPKGSAAGSSAFGGSSSFGGSSFEGAFLVGAVEARAGHFSLSLTDIISLPFSRGFQTSTLHTDTKKPTLQQGGRVFLFM